MVWLLSLVIVSVSVAQSSEFTSIKVGSANLLVEVADDPDKRQKGLMFRTALEKNKGMLFVFEKEEPLSFWMKNTFIPLSIGYFNKKKELIEVMDMVPVRSSSEKPNSYASSAPAMYALEVNRGWFSENKIRPGSKLHYTKSRPKSGKN